jgi:methionyl-tRNA synthetase
MEKNFKRTTVTSALPYANGPVHIGHLAGVYVPADIYVRYLRLKKEDVLFIGGSDEHGVPITIRAKKEGITPQDVVDRYHFLIKKSFEEFGISFDVYSRTSSKTHHALASDFFRKLYDKGEFIEKTSTMKKRTSSLPTAISQANARTAIRKELTATNAKSAELPFHRQTLSIRRVPSVAANR